ncbi:hypothetical protein EG835_05455 [bacterium]|nr:hypothetical protein [bacterium]
MSSLIEALGQPTRIKPELQDWSGAFPAGSDDSQRQVLYLTWEYGFRPLPLRRPYITALIVRYTVVRNILTYTGAYAEPTWY